MTDPFVRPDVRGFLDYLGSIPGPKMHEMDRRGRTPGLSGDEGRHRSAGRRSCDNARSYHPRPGRRHSRAIVRRARHARAGRAGGVLSRRRVRDRRYRYARQLLRRNGARARSAGGVGRLPALARTPLARRARRLRGGGALAGDKPGRAGPRGRRAGRRGRQRRRQSGDRHGGGAAKYARRSAADRAIRALSGDRREQALSLL